MKIAKLKIENSQQGAAMLVSIIFFLFIMLAIIVGLVGPSIREFRSASVNVNAKKSFYLSESGGEDAYYRLKNGLSIGTSEVLTLDGNTATTTITDSGYNEKTINILGDSSSRQRKNKLVLAAGDGVAFSYGVQVGSGGISIGNNSVINGSVYSNGPITGAGAITGSATSAGPTGLIDGIEIGTGSVGNAYAHTVEDSDIAGINYCQVGSGNNKACNTTLPDQAVINMPITDEQINGWKSDAEAGGVIVGNYTVYDTSTSLGPKKITGNLTVENNAILTMTGTLWVEGGVTLTNNAQIKLSASYGTGEGVLVADGNISFSNNATGAGSGQSGSYITLLSTSTSGSAISLANNGGAVVLNAANGTVSLANNGVAKALNGKTISLSNNAVINYDSGLLNSNFVNGPSGSWDITSWKEVE